MKLKQTHIVLILCAFFLVSCRLKPSDPKERAQEAEVAVIRYDRLQNEYVEFNSFLALKKMNTEYPLLTKYLIEDVLKLGPVDDPHISDKLKAYFSDSTLRVLSSDALARYKDMSPIEEKFARGFKRLKKELPSVKIPGVYSQISALNESVVVGDSLLGFSIDKYMGSDYPLYKRFFYDYQCKSMTPERIVPDCFAFYLLSEYPFPTQNDYSLLDCMMHRGKIHYVVGKLLDFDSPGKELGFTEQEEMWCNTNRKSVWDYMLAGGHLHSTDPMVIRKYLDPAPFTAFFGDDSPSMTGVWMGKQIVESYMKHHKDVSIEQLMKMTDYRRMLADADFNP